MDRKSRIAINRANSLKSTGPRTDAGKNIARANSLKHGLSSRRLLDIDGVSDKDAFTALQSAFVEEYEPQTVAEVEVVTSMIETQWQLTRVRRLLDLAFLRGGDLMATSKMIDNYSRHQTRLHRMYRDLTTRLDDLLAGREECDLQSGFVLQEIDPGLAAQSDPGFAPQPDAGFVSQDDSDPVPAADPGFGPQKGPWAEPQPPRKTSPDHTKQKQLHEIGFVLQKRKQLEPEAPPPEVEPQEPAA